MNRLVVAVIGCLLAAFPLIVLFGLEVVPFYYLGIFFIVLALLRLWFLRSHVSSQILPLLLCVVVILVVAYAMLSGQPEWFRYYPVAVNGTLFVAFSATLWHGQPMIERMARLTTPELPAAAIPYTRKVTIVWCCFFLANGLAAFYTARWASFEVWAWYNGALAYGLMAALFALEFLVRRRVQGVLAGQGEGDA